MKIQARFSLFTRYVLLFFLGSTLPLLGLVLGMSSAGDEVSRQFVQLITRHSTLLGTAVGLAFLAVFLIALLSGHIFWRPMRDLVDQLENKSLPSWSRKDEWGLLKDHFSQIFSQKAELEASLEDSKKKLDEVREDFQELGEKIRQASSGEEKGALALFSPSISEGVAHLRETLHATEKILQDIEPLRKKWQSKQEKLSDFQGEWSAVETYLTEGDQGLQKIYLLFLNSSIESARLGDQGRGVEVVSQELKALHHRMELATQEVSQSYQELKVYFSSGIQEFSQLVSLVEDLQKNGLALSELARAMGDRERALWEKQLSFFQGEQAEKQGEATLLKMIKKIEQKLPPLTEGEK